LVGRVLDERVFGGQRLQLEVRLREFGAAVGRERVLVGVVRERRLVLGRVVLLALVVHPAIDVLVNHREPGVLATRAHRLLTTEKEGDRGRDLHPNASVLPELVHLPRFGCRELVLGLLGLRV
jgi:hypothetical protein